MRQLDSENGDYDLTSQQTVLTHTPDASNPCLCQGLILFGDGAKDLDGTGGDFEISVVIGSQTLEPDPQEVTFSTATRTCVFTVAFPVPANTQVLLKAKSPNAGDSDVDVTAYLYILEDMQPVAREQYSCSGTVWHVAADGDDSKDGLSWATAKLTPKTVIEAASARDLVLIGPGTFAVGANYIEVPTDVSVRGTGMDATTLTFAQTTAARADLSPGTRSLIEDLTVDGTAGASSSYVAFGPSDSNTACTAAVVRRVRIVADVDGVYVSHTSACEVYFENCRIETMAGGDAVRLGSTGAHTVTFKNSLVLCTGSFTTNRAAHHAGNAGVLRFLNCALIAKNGTSNTFALSAAGGTVEAIGCRFLSASSQGTVKDVYNLAGTVNVVGCEYDRSKTTGTITDVARIDADTTGAVTTDTASREASKADVSALALEATLGGLATPADVNAQVLDVVNVDALVAGVSIAEALRRNGAMISGIVSGAGTGTETFKDYAESANTIVITVDANGNRTAITYN